MQQTLCDLLALFLSIHTTVYARLSAPEYDNWTKHSYTYIYVRSHILDKHERQLKLKTLNIERIILYLINPILSLVGRSVSMVACLFDCLVRAQAAQLSAHTVIYSSQERQVSIIQWLGLPSVTVLLLLLLFLWLCTKNVIKCMRNSRQWAKREKHI